MLARYRFESDVRLRCNEQSISFLPLVLRDKVKTPLITQDLCLSLSD